MGNYVAREVGTAPTPDVTGRWYSLEQRFVIDEGEAKLPRAPITGKSTAPAVAAERIGAAAAGRR